MPAATKRASSIPAASSSSSVFTPAITSASASSEPGCNESEHDTRRQQLYSKLRNMKKKLGRREAAVRGHVEQHQEVVTRFEAAQRSMSAKVSTLQSKLRMLRRRLSDSSSVREDSDHSTSSSNDSSSSSEGDIDVDHGSAAARIRELRHAVMQRDEEIACLQEELQTLKVPSTFNYQAKRYEDNVRQYCYDLLSSNVSIGNVSSVIRSVAKNMFDCELDRLPNTSLLADMAVEMKQLAQMRAAEAVHVDTATTLHTDGTTKHGRKFTGYQVTTGEASFSLGISEMDIGSAQRTLDIMKELLADVDRACKASGVVDDAHNKIVTNVKNTMSDRGSIEKAFNTLFDSYRTSLLPKALGNCEEMTDESRNSMTQVNHFYYGLHFLVGLTDQAAEALTQWEKGCFEGGKAGAAEFGSAYDRKECGTVRLVRTVCKAMSKHGSEQAGVYAPFTAYRKHVGVTEHFIDFRGNRFNILFLNAAILWHLRDTVKAFLSAHGPTNRLLQAVHADLQVDEFLAACRALGIFRKLVTGPLWRVLESRDVSIIDMSVKYQSLVAYFQQWSSDASSLLDGSARPFLGAVVKIDSVSDSLFTPHSIDATTLELLQLLCTVFHSFTSRLLADHLEGGWFASPAPEVSQLSQSVPKTNRLSEKDFAQLDFHMRDKPNASLVALEGIILFVNNKTGDWLRGKSEKERDSLFEAARKGSATHRALCKQRSAAIVDARAKQLMEKAEKQRKKEAAKLKEKEDLTHSISQQGFWQDLDTARAKLSTALAVKDKVQLIKTHIKSRKIVLGQLHDNKVLFQWSRGNHQLTWVELLEHLGILMSPNSPAAAPQSSPTDIQPPPVQAPSEDVGSSEPPAKRGIDYPTFQED